MLYYYNPASVGFEQKKVISGSAGYYNYGESDITPVLSLSAGYQHAFGNKKDAICLNISKIYSGSFHPFSIWETGLAYSHGFKIKDNNFLRLGGQLSFSRINYRHTPVNDSGGFFLQTATNFININAGIFYNNDRFFTGVAIRSFPEKEYYYDFKLSPYTMEIFRRNAGTFKPLLNSQAGYIFNHKKKAEFATMALCVTDFDQTTVEINNTVRVNNTVSAGMTVRKGQYFELAYNFGFIAKNFELSVIAFDARDLFYEDGFDGVELSFRTTF
ncbi:MAG: type IX secretion system membrane protein PorP/SprF [Bacteroidia bacterium]